MGFFGQLARPFKWVGKTIFNLFKAEAYKFAQRYKDIFVAIIMDIAESKLVGDSARQQEAVARAKSELKGIIPRARSHFINFSIELFIVELKSQKRIP